MTPILLYKEAHGDVRPDKSGAPSDRLASREPYRPIVEFQSSNPDVQSPDSRVPLTAQVKRFVKEQIQHLAASESTAGKPLSVSEVAAALLERAVQQTADMRYGSLLEPIIKQEIHRDIQAYSNRTAHLALDARAEATLARIYTEIILSLILQNNLELFTKYQQAAREEA